jgi:hypothetical protein
MEFRVLGALEVEDDGRALAAEPPHHDAAELTTTPREPSRESRDGPRFHRVRTRSGKWVRSQDRRGRTRHPRRDRSGPAFLVLIGADPS